MEQGPLGWCPPARYGGSIMGFPKALKRLSLVGWSTIIVSLTLWFSFVSDKDKTVVVLLATMFTIVEYLFTAKTEGFKKAGSTPE
jgi:hypothetical protein